MSKFIEEWRPVKGYEGLYEVSDWGNVRGVDRVVNGKNNKPRLYKGKLIKKQVNKDGYYYVGLHENGIQQQKQIHQLVAEAFIPNPDKLSCVHHINTNRKDNRVENIQWCTPQYNASTEDSKTNRSTGAIKRWDNKGRIKIRQYSIDGEIIRDFPCSFAIERELGFHRSAIIRVCKGTQKTSYGYKWSYLD